MPVLDWVDDVPAIIFYRSPFYAPHKLESMADMMEIRKTCVDNNMDILIGLFKDDDSKG